MELSHTDSDDILPIPELLKMLMLQGKTYCTGKLGKVNTYVYIYIYNIMVNNISCVDCLLYHSIEAKTERLNRQTCGFHQQMIFQMASPTVKIIHQQRVHRVQLTRMDIYLVYTFVG